MSVFARLETVHKANKSAQCMCLSELQAGLNVGQPLFPTHALCIRRSQQHRSPPAGIDFRGAFRILNISELHQRNWYL
ncbi:hypothetical protein PDP59_25410, partial [Escherichia coli]|nr:hypothetical protein [Escherichia coli]